MTQRMRTTDKAASLREVVSYEIAVAASAAQFTHTQSICNGTYTDPLTQVRDRNECRTTSIVDWLDSNKSARASLAVASSSKGIKL